jgi:hypothetical protein
MTIAAWTTAAGERDRIVAAAAALPRDPCGEWAVSGVPADLNGVPLFVNGFPEAMRAAGAAPSFRIAAGAAPGRCHARWSGDAFVHD